jgi:hypothetical protein
VHDRAGDEHKDGGEQDREPKGGKKKHRQPLSGKQE